MRLTGHVSAETACLSVSTDADLSLTGRLAPSRALAGLSGTLSDVTVRGQGLDPLVPFGVEALAGEMSSPRLTVEGGMLSGPFALTAVAGALDVGVASAKAVRLDAAGHVEASAAGGTATLDAATLDLTAPMWPGVWDDGGDLSVALADGRPHTLALDLTAPDGSAVILDTALAPVALSGAVAAEVESVVVAGRIPWRAEAPLTVSLVASAVRGPGWQADDVVADLALRPDGPTLTAAAVVPHLPGELAGAVPLRHPLRPLRFRGTLAPDPDEPARFSVDAAVGAPFRATLVTARGWIGRDGQDGRLRFNAPRPLPLGSDGVQPWHLHGALSDLSASAGTFAVEGAVTWKGGGRPRPDLSFGLADVDAAFGATRLTRLNGVVRLTGFAPPRSPSQELVAAGLQMGLPFSDLVVRYRLDGAGAFLLEEVRMRFAGAEIVSDRATIPLAGFERVPLTLTVRGLELSQLAAMTPIDDLAVTGTVNGQVPMVILPGEVRIDAGRLAAAGPGVVQYTGQAFPAGPNASAGVDLAARALENFQYTGLSMAVDGSTRDDLSVLLRLSGANAEVLDGYPFELNLNLSGPLTKIIQEGLQGYTIPGRIRERLIDMNLK